MDYFQAQDLFKKMYPDKKIDFEFDENCHRFNELVMTNGNPNLYHHIENNQVKVTVEGQDPIYVPIMPHRETCTWAHIQNIITNKDDVHIHDKDLEIAADSEEKIVELAKMSGLLKDHIKKKIADYKKRTS